MDTIETGDKVVFQSDLAKVEGNVIRIGEDVDDLSAQIRELREELRQKGVIAPRHAFA